MLEHEELHAQRLELLDPLDDLVWRPDQRALPRAFQDLVGPEPGEARQDAGERAARSLSSPWFRPTMNVVMIERLIWRGSRPISRQ